MTTKNDVITKNAMSRTEMLVMTAVFAAMTGVLSWISIPLPFTPVPINLALVGVLLAANVMTRRGNAKGGAIAVLVYILMGAIGIPVFHSGSAGIGVLLGPTGGFIVGYAATALFVGYLGLRRNLWVSAAMNFLGILCCYAFGLMWYVMLTGSTLMAGLTACVLPFLTGDVLKSVLVAWINRRIRV